MRLAVRRITAINHPTALASVVSYFVTHGDFRRKKVKVLAQKVARYSLSYSLAHIPWAELHASVTSSRIE